jgi:hypothetical protein
MLDVHAYPLAHTLRTLNFPSVMAKYCERKAQQTYINHGGHLPLPPSLNFSGRWSSLLCSRVGKKRAVIRMSVFVFKCC